MITKHHFIIFLALLFSGVILLAAYSSRKRARDSIGAVLAPPLESTRPQDVAISDDQRTMPYPAKFNSQAAGTTTSSTAELVVRRNEVPVEDSISTETATICVTLLDENSQKGIVGYFLYLEHESEKTDSAVTGKFGVAKWENKPLGKYRVLLKIRGSHEKQLGSFDITEAGTFEFTHDYRIITRMQATLLEAETKKTVPGVPLDLFVGIPKNNITQLQMRKYGTTQIITDSKGKFEIPFRYLDDNVAITTDETRLLSRRVDRGFSLPLRFRVGDLKKNNAIYVTNKISTIDVILEGEEADFPGGDLVANSYAFHEQGEDIKGFRKEFQLKAAIGTTALISVGHREKNYTIWDHRTHFTVTETYHRIIFDYSKKLKLEGRVVLPDGTPVPDLQFSIIAYRYSELYEGLFGQQRVILEPSDHEGRIFAEVFPAPQYAFMWYSREMTEMPFGYQILAPPLLTLEEAESGEKFVITLDPAPIVEGQVTAQLPLRIEDCFVSIIDVEGQPLVPYVQPSADGRFRFSVHETRNSGPFNQDSRRDDDPSLYLVAMSEEGLGMMSLDILPAQDLMLELRPRSEIEVYIEGFDREKHYAFWQFATSDGTVLGGYPAVRRTIKVHFERFKDGVIRGKGVPLGLPHLRVYRLGTSWREQEPLLEEIITKQYSTFTIEQPVEDPSE